MKRMWTIEELIALAQEYGGSAETIIPQLYGKFVRLIDASDFSALDAAGKKSLMKEGIFINGNLSGKNDILFTPGYDLGGTLYGFAFYCASNVSEMSAYSLSTSGNISYEPIVSVFNLSSWQLLGYPLTSKHAPSGGKWILERNPSNQLAWVPSPAVNIAPEFDSAATYALGALVLHEGLLYKCTTAVETAGDWDATDWTRTTLAEVIAAL